MVVLRLSLQVLHMPLRRLLPFNFLLTCSDCLHVSCIGSARLVTGVCRLSCSLLLDRYKEMFNQPSTFCNPNSSFHLSPFSNVRDERCGQANRH